MPGFDMWDDILFGASKRLRKGKRFPGRDYGDIDRLTPKPPKPPKPPKTPAGAADEPKGQPGGADRPATREEAQAYIDEMKRRFGKK